MAGLLLVIVAAGGCGGGSGGTPGATATLTNTSVAPTSRVVGVTATLGIYSGRPDPSWDLTAADAAAVVAMIDGLPTVTGTPPQGGLGYRGFTLLIHRAGQDDATLVAYRGTVAQQGIGPRPSLADPGRTVERFLLDAGRSTLTPVEVAAVEADLGTVR